MVQIEIEDLDAALVKGVLEECLSDLRMEVANTDSMDFREALKSKQAVLRTVIGRLERALLEGAAAR